MKKQTKIQGNNTNKNMVKSCLLSTSLSFVCSSKVLNKTNKRKIIANETNKNESPKKVLNMSAKALLVRGAIQVEETFVRENKIGNSGKKPITTINNVIIPFIKSVLISDLK